MGCVWFYQIFILLLLMVVVSSDPLASHSISPNFHHINQSGSSLISENKTFQAPITSAADNASSPEIANPGNSRRRRSLPLVALILIPSCSFLLLACATLAILWFRCRRKQRLQMLKLSNSSAEDEIVSIPGLPVRYELSEVVAATENFKTQIGSGGFGAVYKGTLLDKTTIAVKKITSSGVRGKKEFCREIAVVGSINHINLVRLNGFCVGEGQRFLVLEYMDRGSLDHALFGDGPVLEWQERFQIALGAARGLAYLHGGCEKKIIHCDVKPENILLSRNMQVKISDFGLSKLLSSEESGFFTTMRGTRGYLAPEWLTSSTISDKIDVYGFGMVLLEIVSGRKNCSDEHEYFPLLALRMHDKGRYLELADPRVEGRVKSEEVEMLIRVGLCCVHEDPTLRPSMANVVAMLEGVIPLGQPMKESLKFLHFWGCRFMEASMPENMADRTLTSTSSGDDGRGSNMDSRSHISSQPLSGPR